MDKKAATAMKEQLKKKMEVSLDTTILQAQEQLDEATKTAKKKQRVAATGPVKPTQEQPGMENLDGILANEAGGLGTMGDGSREVTAAIDSARKTDSVLKLLDMQTKMHKEKVALESYVDGRVQNPVGDERRRAYVAAMMSDGTPRVRASQTRDGSRRVSVAPTAQDSLMNKNMDDLLKTLKSNMQ